MIAELLLQQKGESMYFRVINGNSVDTSFRKELLRCLNSVTQQ